MLHLSAYFDFVVILVVLIAGCKKLASKGMKIKTLQSSKHYHSFQQVQTKKFVPVHLCNGNFDDPMQPFIFDVATIYSIAKPISATGNEKRDPSSARRNWVRKNSHASIIRFNGIIRRSLPKLLNLLFHILRKLISLHEADQKSAKK